MNSITYKDGYKYQLKADYRMTVPITNDTLGRNDFIELHPDGTLIIKKGYAWDGPSGPTIDTKSFMRGSLVHDALYQLMREDLLNRKHKPAADQILHDICVADGMFPLRAWWVLKAVSWFGEPNTDPARKRPLLTAP